MRVLVVFLALSALAAAVQGDYCSDAAESIFLNELHYENAGPDVTEAVEVALPAGVDLSAITVVLYNGGTPAAATAYSTRSLSRASVTFLPDGQWKLAVMTYGTDGVQNGPNDGVAIVATCADGAQKVLQFLCYEGAATASDGPAAGLACTNLPVSEGSSTTNSSSLYLTGEGNKAADFTWTTGTSSFGAVNDEQTFSAPAGSSAGPAPNITCDSTNYTRIAAIQGNSTLVAGATPLSGSVATIGVVVGTSFGTSSRRGFWVADPRPDSDSKTSDSVFVNVGSVVLPFTPVVGDRVTISGSVGEVGGNTQITITQLARCASGVNIAPYVAELSQLPSESNVSSVLEPLEGTRVKVTAPNLRVAENYQLGRYGEILISQGDLYVPTQLIRPGPAAQAMLLNQSYIRLDDGSTRQNPDPVIYPAPQLSPSTTLRAGYSVTSGFEAIVVQVSTQSAPYYILYPVNASNIKFNSSTSPREAGAPARMAGTNVRVVAMNVLNLFLGPPYPTARGASDATEYMRQVTKTVNAISGMKPDVIGAIEVANDGYNSTSTIANLTGLLNEKLGAGTYTYIDPGYPKVGSDVITSKILYRPAVVEPIGVLAVLNRTVNSTYLDIQRPTQAQTFRVKANGANFTFVIAHLKSKGSSCRSYGDPDKGDGQGNCAGVRKHAAAAVVSWLARNPTGVNNTNILLMGDLNAYALEDAVVELTTAGYKNMIHEFVGDSAYSYVFNGRRGYLDHALASPGMAEQVLGVSEWHINAAEPTVFDYNTEYKSSNQVQTYYTPEPIRYSDHDPVIVDLCVTSSAESNASRAQCTVLAEVTNDSSADQALKSEGAAASPKPVTVYTSSHDSLETSLAIWHMIALMSLQLVVSFWLL